MKAEMYYEIYGISGILKLCIYYVRTHFFYNHVKLIRFPIEIRGKEFIDFGQRLTTGKYCRIEAWSYYSRNKLISFGEGVEIGDFVHISAVNRVRIGNNVLIASKVYISDINHGNYSAGPYNFELSPKRQPLSFKPVEIEDNVWIGESVCVMPGVVIGRGSVIGAMSCVTKSIPPYSIAVGNPAKIIKKLDLKDGLWKRI